MNNNNKLIIDSIENEIKLLMDKTYAKAKDGDVEWAHLNNQLHEISKKLKKIK